MRRLLAVLLVLVTALPLWAGARHTVLMDVLKVRELSGILHEEGLEFGATLNRDWLEGQGGAAWSQQVTQIYNRDRISEGIRAGLEPALEGEALEDAISFFASDLGSQIITLENSARRAMADPLVEEQARAQFAQRQGGDDPYIQQINRMIVAGDLINRNVTSALNSNYHFLRALVDGDIYMMSEDEILQDVMSERADIEADTESWLGAFLTLAYSPLSLDELTAYADFSETKAGKALNAGLFAGFDPLYEDISYALGRAMALNMAAEEL
ncbi:DUF2059 domain-containing protein [Sulfitobacter donghicola]|uniref:Uncharacterized protein n=1 Tax=Sulfitobacter donghicola DSW-25 = KCTC 12864 = JCM 14565 TaxID=1300350 RepID=A0A073IT62_9RHOB|nr:DUF2059 domain-containing protein [Sulfitobacter donghicola]KEJ88567.1 hypothetical protein DSW25_15915 [Sulfitobacter donghicola DSW-25 = KCTC 12864 = JCM 14565]KIN69544.1 hypothetical protein Z948_3291 [Sulfitobacter donghicola DSW-25 = KCTC 12864 = JCM 14565]